MQVQIGCHTDSLYSLDTLQRNPEIVSNFQVIKTSMKVGNPWGGLIYVTVSTELFNSLIRKCNFQMKIKVSNYVLDSSQFESWNGASHNR